MDRVARRDAIKLASAGGLALVFGSENLGAADRKESKSIGAFREAFKDILLTREGVTKAKTHTFLGSVTLGLLLPETEGGKPYEVDLDIPKFLIPAGTKAVQVVSRIAVLEFSKGGKPVDVSFAAVQAWAWAARKDGKWFVRTHVEFDSNSVKFLWNAGLLQTFFFMG